MWNTEPAALCRRAQEDDPMRRRVVTTMYRLWLAFLFLALPALAACGSGGSGGSPGRSANATGTSVPLGSEASVTAPSVAPAVQGQVTVFAAASLTDSFRQMAANIQQANAGTKITYNFAGSPTLRTQLAQGAHADVFASADQPNMQGAQQDGSLAGSPQVFAKNRLVLIVPASGRSAPARPQDLTKPGLKIVLAQKDVPVGNYARQAFTKMGQDPAYGSDFNTRVLGNIVSEEPDVKAVVTKVSLGEADAGVVYSTDVTPSVRSQVKIVDIPDQFNIIAQYPIAVVKGAANPSGAQAFVAYVLSPAGQKILKDNGFILPNG